MAMEICDLEEFEHDWPLKKESADIWEELDTIVSTFETSNFLGKGRCKERIDVRQLPLPRSASPDCNKISASSWNSQPRKAPPYNQSQQNDRPQSTSLIRPICSRTLTGGGGGGGGGGRGAVPEAWPAGRVAPRKLEHNYSQKMPLSQQALGIGGGSQGRIATVDLCCDNFDGSDGLSAQKGGKIGAPWRHVKHATGAVGEQYAFVDGSVKIRDGCTLDRLSAGGDGQQPWSLSPSSCKFLRPTFIQAPKISDNEFAERAREGKVYWYIEEKPRLCVGELRARRTLRRC